MLSQCQAVSGTCSKLSRFFVWFDFVLKKERKSWGNWVWSNQKLFFSTLVAIFLKPVSSQVRILNAVFKSSKTKISRNSARDDPRHSKCPSWSMPSLWRLRSLHFGLWSSSLRLLRMSTSKTQKFGKRNQQSCIRQCCIIHSRIYQNTPSSKSISIICNILTRYFCMLIAQLLIVYTLFTAKKQPFNSKWRSKSIKHYVLLIWCYRVWHFHFLGHLILDGLQ